LTEFIWIEPQAALALPGLVESYDKTILDYLAFKKK
jgi:hypothetical protein